MRKRTPRSVVAIMMGVFFLSALCAHLTALACPVHGHAEDTFEPHLTAGDAHCHCVSIPPCVVLLDRPFSLERAFEAVPVPDAIRPSAFEGGEIFHPPLSI